jgi:hypothetical protein
MATGCFFGAYPTPGDQSGNGRGLNEERAT